VLGKGEAIDIAHLDEAKSLVRALEPNRSGHGLQSAETLWKPDFQSEQNPVVPQLHGPSTIHHQPARGDFDPTAVRSEVSVSGDHAKIRSGA
jgi:hypothetical protein